MNSSANTVASGSSRMLLAHSICAAEMDEVAEQMQSGPPGADREPQDRPHRQQREHDQQAGSRSDREDFQNGQSVCARTRIATAISENDSSAPVIQKTTRTRGASVTSDQSGARLDASRPGAMRSAQDCIGRYSASGWFSGRALSKAASLVQAASTATIFG